jgi:hypothetical protein
MEELRRVAAHEVIIGEDKLIQAVVEIEEGRVVNYYEFRDELPLTEWLGGKIEIKRDDEGILRAYQNNKVLC